MAKTMTPSSITAGQIGKIQELLGAGLRKAGLQSELIEQIIETRGDALTAELVAVVMKYADAVIIPTTMTVSGRTYDILGFLREGEEYVKGDVMVSRAKEMTAHLGQDDGQHLLDHQNEIPVALRGKVVFVFTDWCRPDDPESVCCVSWFVGRWVRDWLWLGNGWHEACRVLRRK